MRGAVFLEKRGVKTPLFFESDCVPMGVVGVFFDNLIEYQYKIIYMLKRNSAIYKYSSILRGMK